MSEQSYMLNIYNPATKQAETVFVPKEVYEEYRRGGWTIENSDRRFRRYETPFTDLRGNYENFDEFLSDDDELLARHIFFIVTDFLHRVNGHGIFTRQKKRKASTCGIN